MESSYLTKQHSNHWHQLRKKAVVTRRTGFAALGLNTLNKQKQYYEKVFEGKNAPLSDEKRDLFEYRSKNEINKLATLVGKYLPVFLPHIIFLKMVVELSTWRMTRTVIAMQSAAVMVLVFRLTGLLMLSLKLHVRDLAKFTPLMCTTNYQYIIPSIIP